MYHIYIYRRDLINSNPLNYPACIWKATGTPGSLWRHAACHMLPAPSAPGHSNPGTQASQAPGCDSNPGHYVLRAIDPALFFLCCCCFYLII